MMLNLRTVMLKLWYCVQIGLPSYARTFEHEVGPRVCDRQALLQGVSNCHAACLTLSRMNARVRL